MNCPHPTSSRETARRRFLCSSYTRGWLCCRGLLMWRDLTSNRLDFYIAQNNVDTLQRRRRSAGIRIGHARRSRDPIFLSGRWITKLSFLSPPILYTIAQSMVNNNTERTRASVCIFLRRYPFSPLRINTPKSFSLSLPNIIRKSVQYGNAEKEDGPDFNPIQHVCGDVISMPFDLKIFV
jgi:hypothetical protein